MNKASSPIDIEDVLVEAEARLGSLRSETTMREVKIIWHKVPAWVPKGFGTLDHEADDGSLQKYYKDFEYWAEIRGPKPPGSWKPPAVSRRVDEPIRDDDFIGTWVAGVSTYDPSTGGYDAAPRLTLVCCAYRVPFPTWLSGKDLTCSPDLSDPVWRDRVSMAKAMASNPRVYSDMPYPQTTQ